MLNPAIAAYGLPVVIVGLVVLVAAVVVLVVDYRRWTGHERAAAKRRHPAGRSATAPIAPPQRGRHRAPIPRPLDDITTTAPIFRRRPL
ncbi:MAG: hypothetical protein AMXMBFR58_37380 [Phycisphaerae bacterium]